MAAFRWACLLFLVVVVSSSAAGLSSTELTRDFYEKSSCPSVSDIIAEAVRNASATDIRLGASLIRLHFHDCFVEGCDGSLLLDNSSSIVSEKDALPNANSARGFELIDDVKAQLERVCPNTVSCADILTLAAQASVTLAGGPPWAVRLGRRDSTTANKTAANENLPSPFHSLAVIKAKFATMGLGADRDVVALSGAHTFGRAQCKLFSQRLRDNFTEDGPDRTLQPEYLENLRRLCPEGGNGSVLAALDVSTPDTFDNRFFRNLREGRALLRSDQVLLSSDGRAMADTASLVNHFARNQTAFFEAFVEAMVSMGNIHPLTGAAGEIRRHCRRVNAQALM